ncbi:MAG TPA: AAA family ATPase, partial [Terracidiphilus sp.]|nr:AAA family ATPase [Terracidiphilus sp.]
MASLFAVEDFSPSDLMKKDVVTGPTVRPQCLAEMDVNAAVLEELALKTLFVAGTLTVVDLSERLCLSYGAANELFDRMRAEQVCQVTGMAGNVPQIAITAQGRTRAADLMAQNRYVGPAPVSFENYAEQVRKQSVRNARVHAADVERAFAELVVDGALLRQLGTALNSGSSVFLYGPPGTGKTTFAEMLSRVLAQDAVWIPHAVEVDGQIITVYDAAIHKSAGEGDPKHDPRWMLCQRPAVLVGGE